MNIDGSNITQVTESGFNPAWSPDGSELAVNDDNVIDYEDRNTFPSASKLWAVNLASGKQRVITTRDAVQASWSPHGQRLAFWGEQKGSHRDIWTVASDGNSEPVPVTDDGFVDWNPTWSPDGQHLYFLSNRGGEMNLWRIAIEESTGRLRSEPEPATLPSNNCQHVSFARNGNSLVYGQSTRSENVWQIGFDPGRGEVAGTAAFLTQGLKRYRGSRLRPTNKVLFIWLAGNRNKISSLRTAPAHRFSGSPMMLRKTSSRVGLPTVSGSLFCRTAAANMKFGRCGPMAPVSRK